MNINAAGTTFHLAELYNSSREWPNLDQNSLGNTRCGNYDNLILVLMLLCVSTF
jgi:hypothetical protein